MLSPEEMVGATIRRRRLNRLPPRPLDADSDSCPKCRFSGDVDRVRLEGWKEYIHVTADQAVLNGLAKTEIMLVNCGRCGYRWGEPVAQPEVPAS